MWYVQNHLRTERGSVVKPAFNEADTCILERTSREVPLPSCLLLGSSRNSRKSHGSGGISRGVQERLSSGTRRTLSDVGPEKNFEHEVQSGLDPLPYHAYLGMLPRSTPRGIPYMRASKLCGACGVEKPVGKFYRVHDVHSTSRDYWYPSARCKPCHNALRSENRRAKKHSVFPLFSRAWTPVQAPKGRAGALVKTTPARPGLPQEACR